ncbi:MAG: hypothetical protein ABJL72_14745 [Roseobacter sp.]
MFGAFFPSWVLADNDISSTYELDLFYPFELTSGQANLAIFVKSPGPSQSSRTFHNVGFSDNRRSTLTLETEVFLSDDSLYTSVAGVVVSGDGEQLFLPVRLYDFTEVGRRDRAEVTLRLYQSGINAFRNSYPFTDYSCRSEIAAVDLEKVILAARTLLVERETYLSEDEGWNCLTSFLNENAYELNKFEPSRINNVLQFLSEYRSSLGATPDDRFTRFYLDFLNIVVDLRVLGTPLTERLQLVDHLRSEFTEIYTKSSDVAFLSAGETFELLSSHSASDVCLSVATSLFSNISPATIQFIKRNGRGTNSAYNAMTFAMVKAMSCAVESAPVRDIGQLGEIRSAAKYLISQNPQFVSAFTDLYDKLDSEGVFLRRDQTGSSQTALVTSYYDELISDSSGS